MKKTVRQGPGSTASRTQTLITDATLTGNPRGADPPPGTALVVRASEILRDAGSATATSAGPPVVLLPPCWRPALAALCHVLQPRLTGAPGTFPAYARSSTPATVTDRDQTIASMRAGSDMYGVGSESQDELSRPDLAIMSAGGQQSLLRWSAAFAGRSRKSGSLQ